MKIRIIFFAAILLSAVSAGAGERALPNVIAYQSALFDDGGNPIADGEAQVAFRIRGSDGALLYEEYQTLDVVRGTVSALVGNGLTENGAPTGGISASALDPTGAKYLEVQVGDFPPTSAMEIASVPYASYSELALGAVEGAIDSLAIADGSIAYEDLSDDLKSRLTDDITGGRGADQIIYRNELESLYRGPESASAIGLRAGLNYSGANDLQGAIQDIDRAVKRRDEKIDTETDARVAANTTLQRNIDNEAEDRRRADTEHAGADTNVHGVGAGNIVGTDRIQTLSNKTLASPTIQGGTINSDIAVSDGVTIDGVDVSAATSTLQRNIDYVNATKVSKSGDTMSGELEVLFPAAPPSNATDGIVQGDKIKVGAALNNLYGLAASNTEGDSAVLNNIRVASGEISDNGTVSVPEPFAVSECKIITSVFSTGNMEGIDAICTRACPNTDNRNYLIRCHVDADLGSGTGCEANLANCRLPLVDTDGDGIVDTETEDGGPCLAHYLMICVKTTQ